jgi:hypothetical protein
MGDKTLMFAKGRIVKENGWRISKYRVAGDKYPTLKIRRVKHGS